MKNLIIAAIMMLISFNGQAQTGKIKGTVSDSSGPLPGASVVIKGTAAGTQTDFYGNFEIEAKSGDRLMVSYIGYKTKYVTIVDTSMYLNILLEEDTAVLEEVVVVGYGIKRERKALGYSVTSVGSESVFSSLSGRVAGVSIAGDSKSPKYNGKEYASGILTAGEINDTEEWNQWLEIKNNSNYKLSQDDWGFYLEDRIKVHVSDENKNPITNVQVGLYFEGFEDNKAIMKSRTDAFGNAYLFKTKDCTKENYNHVVQIYHNGLIKGMAITPAYKEISFELESQHSSKNIDIMFTVDATGSMGDEINYLKSELQNIMARIDEGIEQKRVALTFYRDIGDEYVVKNFDFNADIDLAKTFLDEQYAAGGGDYEEAVEQALKASMSQSWNSDAKSRLLFLMLDAPPHLNEQNVQTIKKQIEFAQRNGIKIIPVVASDANKTVEFLMRFFSVATNGTYVFLTDDSGVGNNHMKPTTDDYEVEKLNDLIVRLIEKYSGVVS